MRIILFTGKGGVGKTSAAAATALRSAELGHRTVVLSTDAAHSLADSFDRPLSTEPVEIAPNLWGQEVEVLYEVEAHWGKLHEYMGSLLSWRGMDDLVSEELTVLPGMEEVASLLRITEHYNSGKYDTIIVDCAPTGETLRLLSFPDVARWWLEKIFPVEKAAAKVLRPMVRPFIDLPLPGNDVFDAIELLLRQLDKMRQLLINPQESSIRLVVNAEKMVVKETQRTYTYLNLFGYVTDAVICNRLIPTGVGDVYFDHWKETQAKYKQLVTECFAPLPILDVPLLDKEIVGTDALREMAIAIYGEKDPTSLFHEGRGHTIRQENGRYVMEMPLPLVEKSDISLLRTGDELVIHVGNQKRNIILPKALLRLEINGAKLDDGLLRISFDGKDQATAKTSKGRR